MGLFGNPAADLSNLLDAMHGSRLDAIDAILAGNLTTGPANLDERMTEAARLASRLVTKGKRDVAVSLLNDWRRREATGRVLFRAGPGESFEQAKERAMAELARMPPDPDQEEKNAKWRRIVDEIARRAGLVEALQAPS